LVDKLEMHGVHLEKIATAADTAAAAP
jgi:hypothetical protein